MRWPVSGLAIMTSFAFPRMQWLWNEAGQLTSTGSLTVAGAAQVGIVGHILFPVELHAPDGAREHQTRRNDSIGRSKAYDPRLE